MAELRRREKEAGIEPDYEVDAFMKAMCRDPKRESIATDYVLHFLGLDVRPHCLSSCSICGANFHRSCILCLPGWPLGQPIKILWQAGQRGAFPLHRQVSLWWADPLRSIVRLVQHIL